eukprot:4371614-Amphidinium_carterae.1
MLRTDSVHLLMCPSLAVSLPMRCLRCCALASACEVMYFGVAYKLLAEVCKFFHAWFKKGYKVSQDSRDACTQR